MHTKRVRVHDSILLFQAVVTEGKGVKDANVPSAVLPVPCCGKG